MDAYGMNDHAIYWTWKVNFNSLIEQKGYVARINKPYYLTGGQKTLLGNTTITNLKDYLGYRTPHRRALLASSSKAKIIRDPK